MYIGAKRCCVKASQYIIDGEIDWSRTIMDGAFSGLLEGGMWSWRAAGVKEVGGGDKGSSNSAFKIGNNAKTSQGITRDDLLNSLDGVTAKSTEIANKIRNKDLGINVLGDELFESYLGCSSNTVAMQVGDQIYVRRSSASLLSDIVHEGTHAIDYLNGVDENLISSWTGEINAYSAERIFQMESGMTVQFESEEDMMVHIWSNYNR